MCNERVTESLMHITMYCEGHTRIRSEMYKELDKLEVRLEGIELYEILIGKENLTIPST